MANISTRVGFILNVSKVNVVTYLNETHPGRNIGHKEQNIHIN